MIDIRNPRYVTPDGTLIDCEIDIDGHWLPFTASGVDSELHGRAIHARLLAGEVGNIAPYQPRTPQPSPPPPTKAELMAQLQTIAAQIAALPE
jgi:hypothetical protein